MIRMVGATGIEPVTDADTLLTAADDLLRTYKQPDVAPVHLIQVELGSNRKIFYAPLERDFEHTIRKRLEYWAKLRG